MARTRQRVGLVGWGAIATSVAEALASAPLDIVAVGVPDRTVSRQDLPGGADLIDDPAELADYACDVVVEAAGRDSVAQWGPASLRSGADFVVSSVSAFADAELLADMRSHAEQSTATLIIQPGALAGVEALAAARVMGIDTVEHRIVKPPLAWANTPAEDLCELAELASAHCFFRGSAADTAAAFPKNANVAMTTALAGIGPERTKLSLIADPGATTNRHEIAASGAFGQLDVSIANQPLPTNPKTSALAALSLVRLMQNRAGAVAI